MTEPPSKDQRLSASERLRLCAMELSRIAGEPPPEVDGGALAAIASRILDLSMHVEFGEDARNDALYEAAYIRGQT